MLKRSHQRILSFIALVAILFASLAPTVSHALEAKTHDKTIWQQVCSATGLKFIATTTQDDAQIIPKNSDSNKMDMHFEHCPYCFSHVVADTPPNISITLFLAEINSVRHIPLYNAPSVESFLSRSNPTRAPPAI